MLFPRILALLVAVWVTAGPLTAHAAAPVTLVGRSAPAAPAPPLRLAARPDAVAAVTAPLAVLPTYGPTFDLPDGLPTPDALSAEDRRRMSELDRQRRRAEVRGYAWMGVGSVVLVTAIYVASLTPLIAIQSGTGAMIAALTTTLLVGVGLAVACGVLAFFALQEARRFEQEMADLIARSTPPLPPGLRAPTAPAAILAPVLALRF